MPRGGKRPGAGRKRGSPNKLTAAMRAKIEASGEVPLDYMLKVMRDENEPSERRDRMAIAAAPFCHPRLQSVQVEGDLTIRHEDALKELE